MRVNALKVRPEVALKIFEEHNILQQEIEDALQDKPKYLKVGGNQYMAVGLTSRGYLTIFFRHAHGEAEITTAYHSSKQHIRRYKS